MQARTGEVRTEVCPHLEPTQVSDVFRLVGEATDTDGVRPINEHVMLHLRYGGDADVRHVLRYETGALVAYGHLDLTDTVEGSSGELVVHPAHRQAGHGRAVLAALVSASVDGRLRLWAHGEHPGAGRLAEQMGFTRARVLWQMRRSLYAPLPAERLPAGVTTRTFRPGEDDEAWVALNALAFADHPEQGALTLPDLHRRMREPWFDAEGFFLAERREGERASSEPSSATSNTERREGELVGFHWTKVHGGTGGNGHGHEPIGEVYAVGVHPRERGAGLGKALTLVGLRHLRARDLPLAMLYVEATNTAAIRVYESLGFTHWDTDVMYRIGPSPSG